MLPPYSRPPLSLSCYNSSSPYSTPTLTLLPMNLFSIELSTATPDHVSPLLRTHSELPCPCTKSTSLNMAHRALGPGTLLRNLPHLMPNSKSTLQTHIPLSHFLSHVLLCPTPKLLHLLFPLSGSIPHLHPTFKSLLWRHLPEPLSLSSEPPVSFSNDLNDPY